MNNRTNSLTLARYSSSQYDEWDNFVRNSKNGTFLVERKYMDYHADRFNDHSLIFYRDNTIIALLPAHIQGDSFCSHNGLTYAGMILSDQTTAQITLELFDLLLDHIHALGNINKIVYTPIPHIYHRYPAEEDLYALFRNNAQLYSRKISTVIEQQCALPFQTLRKRKIKVAQKVSYHVNEDEDFASYWDVLNNNLQERHDTVAVHSLEEIERLHRLFPNNIQLFTVRDEDHQVVAGSVIYETDRVAHAQYISSTAEGRSNGAVDLLFDYLIHNRYKDKMYFDFGSSVESGGWILNEGLIFQKEGFGGRAVMYDTYEIILNNE